MFIHTLSQYRFSNSNTDSCNSASGDMDNFNLYQSKLEACIMYGVGVAICDPNKFQINFFLKIQFSLYFIQRVNKLIKYFEKMNSCARFPILLEYVIIYQI